MKFTNFNVILHTQEYDYIYLEVLVSDTVRIAYVSKYTIDVCVFIFSHMCSAALNIYVHAMFGYKTYA